MLAANPVTEYDVTLAAVVLMTDQPVDPLFDCSIEKPSSTVLVCAQVKVIFVDSVAVAVKPVGAMICVVAFWTLV